MRKPFKNLSRVVRLKGHRYLENKRRKTGNAVGQANVTSQKDVGTMAILMVVEPGQLEWQSVILACSLKHHCKDRFKLYTYCREDRFDDIHSFTQEFFRQNFQTIQKIQIPFFNADHKSTKINICALARPEEVTVFLDTNMLLANPKILRLAHMKNSLSAVQGRISTWTNDRDIWKYCYNRAGQGEANIRLPLRDRAPLYPFYDTGFIVFDNHTLIEEWYRTALKLGYDGNIPKMGRYRNEITLPIAVQTSGLSTVLLDKVWNGKFNYDIAKKRETVFTRYGNIVGLIRKGYEPFADSLLTQHTKFKSLHDLLQFYSSSGTDILNAGTCRRLENENMDIFEFIQEQIEKDYSETLEGLAEGDELDMAS